MSLVAVPRYAKRAAPQQFSKGFFDQELGNIQRGMVQFKVRSVFATSPASMQVVFANDDTLAVDTTDGPVTITLPAPSQVQFLRVTVKRVSGGADAVTIAGTVDGTTDPTLASQWSSITIQSDGTQWLQLASV